MTTNGRTVAMRFLAVAAALALAGVPRPAQAQRGGAEPWSLERAVTIRIDGPISSVARDYAARALEAATAQGLPLLVELDTPGGSVDSMSAIAGSFLNAEVPVVVWVGPEGAQAASAGTFIVLSAHAAGMAPRTTIGAASPVDGQGVDLQETMQRKVTEDLSAQARGYAERRGEAASDWAEEAVRRAVSATAEEALELGVVDAVARDPAALLAALDGRSVTVGGSERVLGAPPADEIVLEPLPMTSGEGLLALLAQPTIALLLLTLGVNALLAELASPGGYVAGLVGVLSLVLGFYGLGAIEANLVGLVFVAAAAALFALEAHTPTKGFAGVAGVGLFVLGAVILFSGTGFGVPWVPILGMAGFSLLFVLFAVGAIARALHRAPVTGGESLIGRVVVVREAIAPRGAVVVDGELWDAVLDAPAADPGSAVDPGVMRGESVEISGRDGFTLRVKRPR